ncbi:MAG: DALR domain-containing protein, partial [Balneolaceae bacterium]
HGDEPARYWMHNNLVTIDGAKMSKSAGNFITLEQLYSGEHELLEQAWPPMVVRFLVLQSHYRSEIDFSNEALNAAGKGYRKLVNTLDLLDEMDPSSFADSSNNPLDREAEKYCDACYETMSDDFNTARTLAVLFDISSLVNALYHGQKVRTELSQSWFQELKKTYRTFLLDILGLQRDEGSSDSKTEELVQLLIELRADARSAKDFETADKVRGRLEKIGIRLKDEKSGKTTFEIVS